MQTTEKLIVVRPAKAKEFLAINTYRGQRKLQASHSASLAEKMVDGRFHIGSIAVIHNGRDYLADGQHQCDACITCGKPFKALLREYFVEECDTKEDVAKIFSQYNVDRPRSRGDVAWIYAAQCGMDDWPVRCVTLCNTALGWEASGYPEAAVIRLSKDANSALLSSNKRHCAFVHDVLFGCEKTPKHCMRGPVVAAIIATHRKNAAACESFWVSVRDGEMVSNKAPAYLLREYLMRCAIRKAPNGSSSGAIPVGFREVFVKCVHAWNLYRNGDLATKLPRYTAASKIPSVL